jgi:hypothetical protein
MYRRAKTERDKCVVKGEEKKTERKRENSAAGVHLKTAINEESE